MGVNFKLPFQLTSQGNIATTSDPNEIATDRVNAIVGTYPGERVMQPDYGINLPMYLFTPDVINDTDLIANDVTTQVSKWEPSITLLDVVPITTNSDFGLAEINIEFSISSDPTFTPSLVATVEVGGNVVPN